MWSNASISNFQFDDFCQFYSPIYYQFLILAILVLSYYSSKLPNNEVENLFIYVSLVLNFFSNLLLFFFLQSCFICLLTEQWEFFLYSEWKEFRECVSCTYFLPDSGFPFHYCNSFPKRQIFKFGKIQFIKFSLLLFGFRSY